MHLSLPRSRLSARSCGNLCWSNRLCCDKLTQPMHTHPQPPSVWSGQATEDCLITVSSLVCLRSLPLPLFFIFIFVPWSKVCFPISVPSTSLRVYTFSPLPRLLLKNQCSKYAMKSTVISWWDGWMASPTQWTWVWASSRSWWRTRKPGMLQSMGSQRVEHNWVTERKWSYSK